MKITHAEYELLRVCLRNPTLEELIFLGGYGQKHVKVSIARLIDLEYVELIDDRYSLTRKGSTMIGYYEATHEWAN